MYKIVPFHASISSTGSGQDVATALQRVVDQEVSGGCVFVQIQELTTFIAGDAGCLGIGAKPGTTSSMSVVVFKKK